MGTTALFFFAISSHVQPDGCLLDTIVNLKEITISNIANLKNFSLFTNNNDNVRFFKSKDIQVKADYSCYEPKRELSVAGIKVLSEKARGGKLLKLTVAMGAQGARQYADGALFENDRKGDNPKAPDLTGILTMPDKSEKRLAGWYKKSDSGVSYLSVAISDKRAADNDSADAPSGETAAEPHSEPAAAAIAESDAASDEPIF